MEITGNGKAAIVIADKNIADRIRKYAREAVIGQNVRNEPIYYGLATGDTETLEDFKKYTESILAIYKQMNPKQNNDEPKTKENNIDHKV
jgi:hypothetical protein